MHVIILRAQPSPKLIHYFLHISVCYWEATFAYAIHCARAAGIHRYFLDSVA
jgi:hypothetical protein